MIMNYYDYWEYDTVDFLRYFIESELDFSSVADFLKRFGLEHYELSIDVKEAKRILLVYGNSEYSVSSADLSWISDRTKVLVCAFENRNLIFVDLDSSCDTYYICSAAFIKVFNKAFPNNNCYVFKTCGGLAVGSMRCFNANAANNFCVTQLFQENTLNIAAEFFDEILFEKYEEIPSIIVNYSPQERCEYVKRNRVSFERGQVLDQITYDYPEEPVIYATYKETCDILHRIASEDDVSSLDVLEVAMIAEQKTMTVSTDSDAENRASLSFEEETKFSEAAYADAEQMLKEMLKNN